MHLQRVWQTEEDASGDVILNESLLKSDARGGHLTRPVVWRGFLLFYLNLPDWSRYSSMTGLEMHHVYISV